MYVAHPTAPKPEPKAGGWWHWSPYSAEWIWCANAERNRCDGHGFIRCRCGGDFCCCGNDGEIECMGCEDCDGDDDGDYDDA